VKTAKRIVNVFSRLDIALNHIYFITDDLGWPLRSFRLF